MLRVLALQKLTVEIHSASPQVLSSAISIGCNCC